MNIRDFIKKILNQIPGSHFFRLIWRFLYRIFSSTQRWIVLLNQKLWESLLKIFHRFLKKEGYWLFPMEWPTRIPFHGNLRAIVEAALNNPKVHRLYFLCVTEESKNLILSLYTNHLSREKINFITLPCWGNFLKYAKVSIVLFNHGVAWPFPHFCFNLWHGIILKRICSLSLTNPRPPQRTDGTLASSFSDKVFMSTATQTPLDFVLNSGLPRNDFFFSSNLPADLNEQFERLMDKCQGRKLVLYAPTARIFTSSQREEPQDVQFVTEEEIKKLSKILWGNNCVLGLRMHPRSLEKFQIDFSTSKILDCSHAQFNEMQMVLKATDILITDYSSSIQDFMLLKRPAFLLCLDYEDYKEKIGVVYPLPNLFKDLFFEKVDGLIEALQTIFSSPQKYQEAAKQLQDISPFFHDPRDYPISQKLLGEIISLSHQESPHVGHLK